MVKTKEELKVYRATYRAKNKVKLSESHAVYRANHKEETKAYNAVYRANHKEEIKTYRANNKNKQVEYQRKYLQTPEGLKINIINGWKQGGIVGDLSRIYDERYLPSTACEVCNSSYKSSKHKHLDHDHDTGLFRQVLCASCNNRDNWKNKVLCQPCNVKDNWRNKIYTLS